MGKLKWKTLLEPSIKLAEDGFIITKPVAAGINRVKNNKAMSDSLK